MARQRGLTLIELLLALAIASLLMAGLYAAVNQSLQAWQQHAERSELRREADFALARIALHARGTIRLLVPQPERSSTAWSESVRDVLAFALGPEVDRNGDGYADADNDKDGRVDEDTPADATNDSLPGIAGIDDNGNGTVDDNIGNYKDDDEDGTTGEDRIDGLDNDGDGLTDEDHDDGNIDFDGDGAKGEDWIDAVVYRLSGTDLLERLPNPGGANGNAYTERIVARRVSAFQATRVEGATGAKAATVRVTLELTGARGTKVSAATTLRVGALP
jgi:prepilin-type N-terminal cleavage/methylation domain-containing protein